MSKLERIQGAATTRTEAFVGTMSIESQAALLLSLSASLPSKSQSIVATPLSQIRTRESLIPAHYGSNELNSSRGAHSLHDALLYVGVTLERPANGSWGLTMFRISQYLVVGGVQQNVMCTSWAWATTTPPKSGGDFRTSFGPLYPTSLLQLVPGDVILSINGQSEFDPSIWHAPRLDILAVRLESARRAAHDVLCLVNVEYRAAEVAFQTMEPMLSRVTLPKACQRQLFPVSHNVSVRKVSEESSLASSQDTSQVTQVRFLFHQLQRQEKIMLTHFIIAFRVYQPQHHFQNGWQNARYLGERCVDKRGNYPKLVKPTDGAATNQSKCESTNHRRTL